MLELHDYQQYKLIFSAASLSACLILQRWQPYHGRIKDIAKNWRLNFSLAFINSVFLGILSSSAIFWVIEKSKGDIFGLAFSRDWLLPSRIFLSILALDFTSFLWHIANHKHALLWRFHSTHHSDSVFDTSTALRFHPVEIFLSLIIRCLIISILGLPLDGVLLFECLFTASNFFEHADMRLPKKFEWLMSQLLIGPALHRKHHSQILADQNGNFGTIFVFWDRLFNTYRISSSAESIQVGLSQGATQSLSIKALLLQPFKSKNKFQGPT